MARSSKVRALHELCTSTPQDDDSARRARSRSRPSLHGERAPARVWERAMSGGIPVGPCAESPLSSAAAWLPARTEPDVAIIGPSIEAAAEVARRALLLLSPSGTGAKASFGWQRSTLGVLAVGIARPE